MIAGMARTTLRTALALCLTMMALTACKDEDSIAGVGRPLITVLPDEVIFSEVAIGDSRTQTVLVENRGNGTLVISDWELRGSQSDEFEVSGLDDLEVEGGESATFRIRYAPVDAAVDSGTLTLFSNAVDNPEVEVEISSQGQAARLLADPGEVSLRAEEVGVVVSQDVILTNIGSSTMQLGNLRLVADTGDFTFEPAEPPSELEPGASTTITISYAPLNTGTDSDQLALDCDATNCENGRFFIPINGLAEAPRLRLSPGDVTFGATPQNPSPVPQQLLTATNDGTGVLSIDSIVWIPNASDTNLEFAIVSVNGVAWDPARTEPWLLGSGESMPIVLSYNPTDAQADLELLEFRSNDLDLPSQIVRVAGRLSAPQLEVAPALLDMPLTARNRTSSRQVSIRNAGAEPLDLSYILSRGGGFDSGVLSLTNVGAAPDFLAPGEEFLLDVRFAPTVADQTFAGTIFVGADNVPDPAGQERRVDVTGLSTTDPVCRIRTLPPTVDFGTVPRGTRRELTGRIVNNGSDDCRITNALKQSSVFGTLFSDSFEFVSLIGPDGTSRPPFDMAPGDEAVLTVAYFPRTITDLSESPFGDTGSIEIRVTDLESPATTVTCGVAPPFFSGVTRSCGVNLQARSAVASIGVIPTEIDFGRVTLGCNSQTQTIRIYNTGGADVDISNIALEDCTAEFTIAGVPVLPTIITRGDSIPFQVRYRPADVGVDECRVVIESTAEGGGRYVVPLRGEGVTYSATTDRFEQVSGREVDVLFVVDNSGSMSEEQSNLARNFSSFISAATTWGSDFQLGVVTTQTDGDIPNPSGGTRQPGELLGNPRIVTPRTPSYQSVFANTAEVGTSDSTASSSERGLEAAYLALTDPNITDFPGSSCTADTDCGGAPYLCVEGADGARACGGFNRSFLRESASLELVFISDEEDSSRAELNFYIDFFRSIKGFRNTSLFHASAIVGPRDGCSSSAGDAVAGDRYIDVAEATDGEVGSICDANFASTLSSIGNRAFGLRVDFYLSRPAESGSVSVWTLSDCGPSPTRTRATTGWTYDTSANSILWTEATAPRPGECFEVDYEAACF